MNERQELLATIIDYPDDDTPRLVFADWLEEHREVERAEFIRLQCAIARRFAVEPSVVDDPVMGEMWDRQTELLKEYRGEWMREMPRGVETQFFRRGFVAGVRIHTEQWLDASAELQSLTPLESVTFTHSPRHFTKLVKDEGIRRLSSLSFASNGLSVQHMLFLTRTQGWPRLRSLTLSGNLLGASAANVLATSKLAEQIEHLDFSNNPIGDEGLYVMASAPRLANLRTLQLIGTRVGDLAVRAIIESPYLKRLHWFRVGDGISVATRNLLESRFPGTSAF